MLVPVAPCQRHHSLVNSIISGHASRTVGTLAEVSTVGIDLLRHKLKGTTVEFYDCAGQVDYAGMHQTFLSRRALYIVVWDVRRCHGIDGEALDEVGGEGDLVHVLSSPTTRYSTILSVRSDWN